MAIFEKLFLQNFYACPPADGRLYFHPFTAGCKAQDKFAKKYSGIIEDTSYRYNALFNGMAVQVRYGNIARLQKDASVKDVIVCERYYAPQVVTQNEVNVYDTGIYNPGDVDYDGTGTIVAVLDTGLDYTHSAFQNQPTGTMLRATTRYGGLLRSIRTTTTP